MLLITLTGLFVWSTVAGGEPFVVSSSPSISQENAEKIFLPLTALLSRNTGKEFVYRYPANWPSYIQNMRLSKYHLLFDEPHIVSWRVENLQHTPILKLSGKLNFVIVARDRDSTIVQLADLAGYAVCAHSPPMMESLILFAQFVNPSRQPQLYQIESPAAGFTNLLAGNCRGAVLPTRLYDTLSEGDNTTRVLYLSASFPNWALSSGPTVTQDMRTQIRNIVLAPENSETMKGLASQWGDRPGLRRATASEYLGYSDLLKDFWGFR